MREQRLRAICESWKLPDGRVIKAQFAILIRLKPSEKRAYRYHPLLEPTMQPLCDEAGKASFAESNLDGCKTAVEKQFEKKVSDWA
jgi:hypothetical protein